MNRTKKFAETWLFSSAGIIGILVLFVAVNIIAGTFRFRADLTEENLYTLSEGTRRILDSIDTPVTVRFYYSKDVPQMPMHLKNYAGRVEDLLKEYRRAAHGNLLVNKLNPKPDSDADDSASLDGVYGQALPTGDRLYMGLAVSCLDETVAIPFLSPDRENFLEYDITRALSRVLSPKRPVLGVMSSLAVMGQSQPPNPMMQMQGMQNKPAWVVISELKADFDVREIQMTADAIPNDIDVLLMIHPTNLTDKTLFAIDQFVLRGGRLAAFLDPMSMIEAQENPMMQMQRMPPASSTLGKLLDAWGIEFDTEKVVADLEYMTRVSNRQGQPEVMPAILSLGQETLSDEDPATAQLDALLIGLAGAFSGTPADGLVQTVLIHTSEKSQRIEKFMAQMPGQQVVRDFESENKQQTLALRLTGTFRTAFPDGPPETAATGPDADAPPDAADSDGEADKEVESATPSLAQSTEPGAVVLVGDSDMTHDHFCVRKQAMFGQQIMTPISDNINLIFNIVENLSGDSNLIGIRSRGAISRPFDVVREMKVAAEERYQSTIRSLEEELAEVRRNINEMQQEKSSDQRFILSPEQQKAIASFREKEGRTSKELKEVRKQFRRDIDALEIRLKWANIALMPFLVGLSGLALALIKRRRMARK